MKYEKGVQLFFFAPAYKLFFSTPDELEKSFSQKKEIFAPDNFSQIIECIFDVEKVRFWAGSWSIWRAQIPCPIPSPKRNEII